MKHQYQNNQIDDESLHKLQKLMNKDRLYYAYFINLNVNPFINNSVNDQMYLEMIDI